MTWQTLVRTALLSLLLGLSAFAHGRDSVDPAEQASMDILKQLESGELRKAENLAQTLISEHPDFRLGHMLYGDIQAIKSGQKPQDIQLASTSEFSLDNLRNEAQLRWQHELYPPPKGSLPSSIAKLSPRQAYALVNDLERSRMYIFKNVLGEPQLLSSHYVGMGKAGYGKEFEGDMRTPLGVYKITGFIPDEQLPDLYGAGAYPINYPNRWDKLQKRTGHGIWIHGVPSAHYNRPPLSSEGCITMNNQAFDNLASIAAASGVTVINTRDVQWLSPRQWNQRQSSLLAALEQWEHDWESLNSDAYLQHYDPSFTSGSKGYTQWIRHKQRVNRHKRFINVELSDISIFEYAMKEQSGNIWQVNFTQSYQSNNLSGNTQKSQLWKETATGWKIIYEGDLI